MLSVAAVSSRFDGVIAVDRLPDGGY